MSHTTLTVASATAALRRGDVVAYPTETFYGLGAIPTIHSALVRIGALKRRDEGKPISLILARATEVTSVAQGLSPRTVRLISLAWPGPLTVVLPALSDVDELVTGGTDTVAVRVPAHTHARILADAVGGAITATSANLQGEPPPTTADAVAEQFPDGLDGIVGGETTPGGAPTTLVRPHGRELHVLRTGVIGLETLSTWWSGEVIAPDATGR